MHTLSKPICQALWLFPTSGVLADHYLIAIPPRIGAERNNVIGLLMKCLTLDTGGTLRSNPWQQSLIVTQSTYCLDSLTMCENLSGSEEERAGFSHLAFLNVGLLINTRYGHFSSDPFLVIVNLVM